MAGALAQIHPWHYEGCQYLSPLVVTKNRYLYDEIVPSQFSAKTIRPSELTFPSLVRSQLWPYHSGQT